MQAECSAKRKRCWEGNRGPAACVRVQLREIFSKVGVSMPCATFDRLYDVAAERSPEGLVSVDTFRGVLEQAQETAIDKYRDTLGY